MSRQFELTKELIDQIIFSMENQNEKFLLDTQSLMIIPDLKDENLPDAVRLPEWNPSDGYQLMDSFTGSLKNPIYRERLRTILNTGRGVFRGFKNVLKERPDLEKAWFNHKDREMKKRVRLWYSELCDFWGVASLGEEPEETTDLFLDNFTMELISPDNEEYLLARQSFRDEIFSGSTPPLKDVMIEYGPWKGSDSDCAVRAMSPDGSGCGFLGLTLESRTDELYALLDCLYVLPEYRGAGIASGLLDFISEYCFQINVKSLLLQIPPEGEVMKNNIKRRGFSRQGSFLLLDVRHWFYEEKENS
jgi:GNAT superfamily N-acetyltransferase